MKNFEALYNLYNPERLSFKKYYESLKQLRQVDNYIDDSQIGILYLSPEDRLIRATTDCYRKDHQIFSYCDNKEYVSKLFIFTLDAVFAEVHKFELTKWIPRHDAEKYEFTDYQSLMNELCKPLPDDNYPYDPTQFYLVPREHYGDKYSWHIYCSVQGKFDSNKSRACGFVTVS